MVTTIDPVRQHLVNVLDWEEAHVGFDKAVDGIPPALRGICPTGFAHTPWQLLEHIRIAQDDILDFCTNPQYEQAMVWPDDYWPVAPAPPDEEAWTVSIASYQRSRDDLKQLIRDIADLSEPVPTGKPPQTYLRAVLLVADHTAYHVGQLVAVRRALGIWP